jgi:hypothetical protein
MRQRKLRFTRGDCKTRFLRGEPEVGWTLDHPGGMTDGSRRSQRRAETAGDKPIKTLRTPEGCQKRPPFIVLDAFEVRLLLAHPPGCGAFALPNRGSPLRAPTPGYRLSSLRDGIECDKFKPGLPLQIQIVEFCHRLTIYDLRFTRGCSHRSRPPLRPPPRRRGASHCTEARKS